MTESTDLYVYEFPGIKSKSLSIYIKLKVCLSVCLSVIEIKLIDDSDRNQNTVLGFPGKSYIRFICLFVSKCLQFYFYSGQTDKL